MTSDLAAVWTNEADDENWHRYMVARLRYEWPALAQAIDSAVEQERAGQIHLPAWYPDNFRVRPAVGPFKGLRCSVTRPDLPAFPCTQPTGHEGFHEDDMGATWARTNHPKPVPTAAPDDMFDRLCGAPVVIIHGMMHRCVKAPRHGGPHATQRLSDEDLRAAQVAADVRAQHATPDTAELHAHGLEERACPSQFQAGSEGHIVDCGEPAGHPGQHIGRRHAGGWKGVLRRWTDQQAWEEPQHPDGVGATVQEALANAERCPAENHTDGPQERRCTRPAGHDGRHASTTGITWADEPPRCPHTRPDEGLQCSAPAGHEMMHTSSDGHYYPGGGW